MAALGGIAVGIYSTLNRYQTDQTNASMAQVRARYQAGIDTENAALADREAANIIAAGKQASDRSGLETQLEIGATRGSYAGQGVATDSGSAVDTQATEAGLGELDRLTIKNNAANQAYGYTVQADNDRRAAILARMEGDNQSAAYKNDATSTLLTGAVNTYGLFSNYYASKATAGNTPSLPAGWKMPTNTKGTN